MPNYFMHLIIIHPFGLVNNSALHPVVASAVRKAMRGLTQRS